jgi:RNA polymerase subunit RPABC4/transcription elongation factor Spt4
MLELIVRLFAERRACGTCGSTLTTSGTCPTCDYRRRY